MEILSPLELLSQFQNFTFALGRLLSFARFPQQSQVSFSCKKVINSINTPVGRLKSYNAVLYVPGGSWSPLQFWRSWAEAEEGLVTQDSDGQCKHLCGLLGLSLK